MSDCVAPLVVFAGGGTGGHLYPALAVAEALRERLPHVRTCFFATQRAIDRQILDHAQRELVEQQLVNFQRAPWRWPAIYRAFRQSCLVCRRRFEADRPAIVVGSGGISSVPAIREAAQAGIPVVLLNPDAVPGRANRFLAKRAATVIAQFEETAGALPRATTVEVLGCAVRSSFNRATRDVGMTRFDLNPRRKTLLITGASQGARSVNEAVVVNLDFLAEFDDWQVVHLTGEADYETVCIAYARAQLDAKVLAFTEHMADILAAADLVVSRAGASTLAELTAVGRASILLPYPYHRDQHQMANARCLVRAQAARIVRDRGDAESTGGPLRDVLGELMRDDEVRVAMGVAARRLGRGQAAEMIADRLLAIARLEQVSARVESMEASGKPAR